MFSILSWLPSTIYLVPKNVDMIRLRVKYTFAK